MKNKIKDTILTYSNLFDYYENILIISYRPDTAIIRLLDDKSKAILTIKGKKIYEFIVRELKGIDDYSIEAFVYIMNITIIVVLL